jgi:hypothetical protein
MLMSGDCEKLQHEAKSSDTYFYVKWTFCLYFDMKRVLRCSDMVYLTAIGLTPGGSSTVHIYTNNTQNNTIDTNNT